MTIARLFLGIAMMPYALDKLLVYQFKIPAWSYAQPLGLTSGSTLTWALLCYSPHFQMILGLFELIPALMLLNVRTRRLGALFMFPVLLNVVLVNYSLDLWRDTKIVSTMLLAVNAFLLLYDHSTYLKFLKELLVTPHPTAGRRILNMTNIASFMISATLILVFAAGLGYSIVHFQNPVSDFVGARQINSAGTWKIDSLSIAGQPIAIAPGSSFYFNLFSTCVYGDIAHPSFGTFHADKPHHAFDIEGIRIEGSTATIKGSYQIQGSNLTLNGNRNNQPLVLVLERSHWDARH